MAMVVTPASRAAWSILWPSNAMSDSVGIGRPSRATTAEPSRWTVTGADVGASLIFTSNRLADVLDPAHGGGQRLGAVGVVQGLRAGDQPLGVELEQVLVERLHAALAALDVLS